MPLTWEVEILLSFMPAPFSLLDLSVTRHAGAPV